VAVPGGLDMAQIEANQVQRFEQQMQQPAVDDPLAGVRSEAVSGLDRFKESTGRMRDGGESGLPILSIENSSGALEQQALNGILSQNPESIVSAVQQADGFGEERVQELAKGVREALQRRFGAEAEFSIGPRMEYEPGDPKSGFIRTTTERFPGAHGSELAERSMTMKMEDGGLILNQEARADGINLDTMYYDAAASGGVVQREVRYPNGDWSIARYSPEGDIIACRDITGSGMKTQRYR